MPSSMPTAPTNSATWNWTSNVPGPFGAPNLYVAFPSPAFSISACYESNQAIANPLGAAFGETTMSEAKPSVFVSSTCYDLGQIRADLRDFITSLGYDPMLSDYNSFPISPDSSPVDNCLKAIESHADIYVLIIGGKYGSMVSADKSVTNLEYLQARAKGIPVYAFVQKNILDILPVWKANPKGDFNSVVDSTNLFEFVSSLRETEGVWVFPFDKAHEIMDTLRKQWAYLFMEALRLWTKTRGAHLSKALLALPGPALRLVITRPKFWEYLLFSEVFSRGIADAEHMKLDLNYEIAFGKGQRFDGTDILGWLSTKTLDAARLVNGMMQIVNVAFPEAMGPSGTPGDPDRIVYVANRLVSAYREAIEWAEEFRRVQVDEDFQKAVNLQARFTRNMIEEVENLAEQMKTTLEQLQKNPPVPGEHRTIKFSLNLTMPACHEEFMQELGRLKDKYTSGI